MGDVSMREAADTTGWSPRMLRYLEQTGLVTAQRSGGGHRRYSPRQVERLLGLHTLLARHDITINDLAYERRLRTEPDLARDVDAWFGPIHRIAEHPAAGLFRRLAHDHPPDTGYPRSTPKESA